MARRKVHVFQRVCDNIPALDGKERELRRRIHKSARGFDIKERKIVVKPHSFHLFFDIKDSERRAFFHRLKDSISGLGVRWKSDIYCFNVPDISNEYIKSVFDVHPKSEHLRLGQRL